jgi:hypothetical protein
MTPDTWNALADAVASCHAVTVALAVAWWALDLHVWPRHG